MNFADYIAEKVSNSELAQVEKFADALFKEFDIDVEFQKHFKDRLNDNRNKPDISASELKAMFQGAFKKHAKRIADMPDGREAMLLLVNGDVNLPFMMKWDKKNKEFDLIPKTVMRKKNFTTRTRTMKV